jgi:hypothetical protein
MPPCGLIIREQKVTALGRRTWPPGGYCGDGGR